MTSIFKMIFKKLVFTFDTESSCLQHVTLQEENRMSVGILAEVLQYCLGFTLSLFID